MLCLLAIIYFLSSWVDADFWYGPTGPLSNSQVASFLATSGLGDTARWIVSPLFLTGTLWVYYAYLAIAMLLAVAVLLGKGGRVTAVLLWLAFVGWANRAMLVSGLTESLFSLALFAAAIAPPIPLKAGRDRIDWTAQLSQRLIAIQGSLILLATFLTMLGGRVWFNGLGAYALAAPVQNRTFDLATTGILRNPSIHEALTHLIVIAIPAGLLLAWIPATCRVGKTILWIWCGTIALLGSMWLYGALLACMISAIDHDERAIQ